MCDASDFAVGAVLGQRKDKALHVIYYASKTSDDAQRNYALENFRMYLLCSKEFDQEIRDKKGAENVVADHLSRQVAEQLEQHADRRSSQPIDDSFPDDSLMSI
ncbi:hypothetical protein vseg_018175 [Gypsophila vaccaria]